MGNDATYERLQKGGYLASSSTTQTNFGNIVKEEEKRDKEKRKNKHGKEIRNMYFRLKEYKELLWVRYENDPLTDEARLSDAEFPVSERPKDTYNQNFFPYPS